MGILDDILPSKLASLLTAPTYTPPKPDRSVMNNYQPQTQGWNPQDDALQAPNVLGGLLSIDPTDYVGPGTLAKAGALAKALLGGAAHSALPAAGLGIIHDLPTLRWNMTRGEPSFPVGDWRTEGFIPKSEMNELARDPQSQTDYGETLRALKNLTTGRIEFAWPWAAAHHSDIGNRFGLDPANYAEITIEPPRR